MQNLKKKKKKREVQQEKIEKKMYYLKPANTIEKFLVTFHTDGEILKEELSVDL